MSATQQTLAQMIRSKYPNQYGDMDDATLEEKVLAKYPQYGDLPRTQARPTEAQQVANRPQPQQPIPAGLQPTERAMQQTIGGPPMFVDVPKGQGKSYTEAGQKGYEKGGQIGSTMLGAAQLGTGLATAPFATTLGLGGGAAGSYAGAKSARYGAEKLGASPGTADIAAAVGGLLGGLGGGMAGGIGGAGIDERIPWANKGITNAIAGSLRYPATARQSQLGRPGTVKSFLPSFMQKYTVPEGLIPTGEPGTPTNPGPYMELPWKVPKAMQGDPFNPAPKMTGGAQQPFEPLIYSSETEPQEIQQRMANLKRQASSAGTYHAAQGSATKKTNLQQRIGKKYLPWESEQ